MSSPSPSPEWQCARCARSASQLGMKKEKERDLVHGYFCLGLDSDGHYLGMPDHCFVPGCVALPSQLSANTWKCHYATAHQIQFDEDANLTDAQPRVFRHVDDVFLYFNPDFLPTPEMNARFGTELTRVPAVREYPDIAKDIGNLYVAPGETENLVKSYLTTYRQIFGEVFEGAVPLTYHAHVSDIAPSVVMSSILYLEGYGSNNKEPPTISPEQRGSDRFFAVTDQSYGSFYGQMARVSPREIVSWGGCGSELARMPYAAKPTTVARFLAKLKRDHYTGIIVEMLSTNTGAAMRPETWRALGEGCAKEGLFLIVDEAQTAIRCGAPLACLLHQYKDAHRPSFVLLSKGMKTCTLAVFPNGISIDRFKMTREDVLGCCRDIFDKLPSDIVYPSQIMEATAVLRQIRDRDLPKMAGEIGDNLRAMIARYASVRVQGLGALLYMPTRDSHRFAVIGAAVGNKVVRWMPYVDDGMRDRDKLDHLFGPEGQEIRQRARSTLDICVVCHDHGPESSTCETCCSRICSDCAETVTACFKAHLEGRCLDLFKRALAEEEEPPGQRNSTSRRRPR